MSERFWEATEPKPKALRHVRLIDGLWDGIRTLVVGGTVTPNQAEVSADNPDGYHPHRLVNHEFLEARLELLVQYIKIQTEANARRERLLFNILQHLKGNDGDEVEIDPPPPNADLEP